MENNAPINHLINLLLNIKTKAEMKDFLLGIFTTKELEEIPRRLEIVNMLKKGIPQHEVARRLMVGVATVTRASKELQKGRFKNT